MKIRPGDRALSPAIVLQPYQAPSTGWRRYAVVAAILALSIACVPYGFFYAITTPYLIVPLAAPLAGLAMVAIWALPDTRTKPIPGIETCLFAFLAALILWPNYIAISLPGIPWITVIRLFGFPLAFLFLVSLSTTSSYRAINANIHRNSLPIWKFIAVLAVMQVITIPLSGQIATSIQKAAIWQINLTCIFFVAAYIFSKPGKAEQWLMMLLACAVVLSGVGILEGREKQVLWAGHIPSFLKVDMESISGILTGAVRGATGLYRVKGISSTPLGLAEVIALLMPFVIHLAVGRFKTITRVVAAVTIVALVFVVLSTDSRLGVVGTLLSALLYFAFWCIQRWRRRPHDLFAPAILFTSPIILALGVASTFFVRALQLKVWGGGAQQASNRARGDQIEMGLPMILKNPIGHGAGQGAETLGYLGGGGKLTIDNYFLSIGLEYGVVGFIAFYGMFGYAAWHAGRQALSMKEDADREFDLFAPLSIALTTFIVIKSVFSQQENHSIAYAMLGMVVALTYRYRVVTGNLSAKV